jgi:hypothetical protein
MKIQIVFINRSIKHSKGLSIASLLIPILFLGVVNNMSLANATSEADVSCYDRGIIDGEDHPFNQGTFDRCGDDYYEGFLQGCMSVEGNNRDVCENAADG